jgi:hypothetical protein
MIPDTGAYEAKRRGVEDQYTSSAARNSYTRFLAQQRGERGMSDMSQGFKRSFPTFGASFAPRGMAGPGVNSGVMQRSMKNYVGDFNRNYARAGQELAQGLQGYDLEQADLDAWKTRSLADIEMDKQREISQAAQYLEALRPLFGGT